MSVFWVVPRSMREARLKKWWVLGKGLASFQEKVHFIMLQMQQNMQLLAVHNGRHMHIHIFINILIYTVFVCKLTNQRCRYLSCNAVSTNVVHFTLHDSKNALYCWIVALIFTRTHFIIIYKCIFLHTVLISEKTCLIKLSMLAWLMHLKHS